MASHKSRSLRELDACIVNGLIVSCQPVEHGPLDHDESVVRFARAALDGGADGLRIEGANRLANVRAAIPDALIIGIVKRDLPDSPVRITPLKDDVIALANAGADIIAVDATQRIRPTATAELISLIHSLGRIAMADCSNIDDAQLAYNAGAEILGTTLSGYTGGPVPENPDFGLLEAMVGQFPRVMAEGRFNSPIYCAMARDIGAWAVTVGTAITRTEVVTQWFAEATRRNPLTSRESSEVFV